MPVCCGCAKDNGVFFFSHVSRALKALLKDVQTKGTEIDEDDVEEDHCGVEDCAVA